MSDTDHNQELPEPVLQNAAKIEAEQLAEQKATTDLLEELVSHVDKNDYIPWEKVKLPSRGVYYGNKLPDGFVEIKPMGVDVDKMLTNQRLIQSGELLNKILESCTILPPEFSIREMLAGDFNFLLYYLRGITHGPAYEFTSECPHCKTRNMYDFDLTELTETVTGPSQEYPEEPMRVALPELSRSFGKSVEALVRLVRVDDVMKMSRPGNDHIFDPMNTGRARTRKKNKNQTVIKNEQQNFEKIYEDNMKSQIVGFMIEGQIFEDERRYQIIDNLHQKDSASIRDFIDEISPGIDTVIEVTCQNPECGQDTSINLPWGENFFRPK